MVLPFDLLGRKWLDLGASNPNLIKELRPLLVFFVAFDRARKATALGSGVITADFQGAAVALTARHVLAEFAVSAQKPHINQSSSLFQEFKVGDHLSVHPEHMKAGWMGQNSASFLNVLSTNFNDFSDLQGCLVASQAGEEAEFIVGGSVPIDLRPLRVGEVIYQISCGGLILLETEEPMQRDGIGQKLQISNHVSLRVGTVTEIFPRGRQFTKGPAFTTSIPSSPGMSGGAVLRIENNRPSICGVISSDFSTEHAHNDFFLTGVTVAMMVWPALGLRLSTSNEEHQTWFEAMQRGVLPMPIGGLDGFLVCEVEGGDVRMAVPTTHLPVP